MATLNSVLTALLPVMYVIMWTLILGALGAGIWYVWRELQYKYKAIVQHVDNQTNKIKQQKVVRVRRKNRTGKMHLKKFNEWIEIPEPKYWIPHNKNFAVFLQWDGKRLFSASDVSYNETVTMSAAEYDAVEDLAKRIENAKVRHGLIGHWDKYGMYYMVFFIVIAHLFALMMLTDVADGGGNTGAIQGGVQTLTASGGLWLTKRQLQL